MPWHKVDSIIVTNYFQYWKHPLVNKYLDTKQKLTPSEHYEGMLILNDKKKPIWISHPFNYTQAKKSLRGVDVKQYSTKKEMQAILKKNCGKIIGFDSRHTAVSTLRSLKRLIKGKFVDVSKEIEDARAIKTAIEIKKVRNAVEETKKVLVKVVAELKEGESEEQIMLKIKDLFELRDCETAFCIVAFGKNTANIHHVSTDKKLEMEMPVMIDCGAKYKGYCADITQSFWFGNKAPKEYTLTREKVKQALHNAEGAMKTGIKASKLMAQVKEMGNMPHALGHGLGLEEHDPPGPIGDKSNWTLAEGQILAIEPAMYTKQYGIRLEKSFLVKKNKAEEL